MLEYELHSYQSDWVMKSIRRSMDSITHKITNTSNVERRITIRVGKYLSISAVNINHKRHIQHLIYREIKDALTRNRREYAEHIADISSTNEEGQEVEYDPEDVLADVNSSNIEVRETITLLAKDDRRKNLVLTEWLNGNTNDSDVSSILADALGGQARSHRIFIQRFRNECRTELSAQAI